MGVWQNESQLAQIGALGYGGPVILIGRYIQQKQGWLEVRWRRQRLAQRHAENGWPTQWVGQSSGGAEAGSHWQR